MRQKGTTQGYDGVMSTNGWDNLLSNQQSYNEFYNKLASESWSGQSLAETLENKTWIALLSQP